MRLGDVDAAENAGKLPDPTLPVKRRQLGFGAAVTLALSDQKMRVGKRGDLSRVRYRKHLRSDTEISELLSFSSVNYFSKFFKKRTGLTPTEYSKEYGLR